MRVDPVWVELDSADKAAAYSRRSSCSYSAGAAPAGRFERPPNVRLRDVMEWLDYKKVVPSDVRLQTWIALGFLLVCLINTVGLLLTKFLRRSAEIGVRRALGASKRSIFVQLLVEAGMIGLVGGVARPRARVARPVGGAPPADRLRRARAARSADARRDVRARGRREPARRPAARVARLPGHPRDPAQVALRNPMHFIPILSTLRRHRTAAALIVLEIALTCAIVCNAVFLIGDRLARMDRPSGVAEDELVRVQLTGIGTKADAAALTAQDLAALRAIPGVKFAAVDEHGAVRRLVVEQRRLDAVPTTRRRRSTPAMYMGSQDLLETLGRRS